MEGSGLAAMFLQLVIHQRDAGSHQHQGVFQAAYDLLERGDVSSEQAGRLKAILVWFERHVTTPDRSKLNERAIFWFKAMAEETNQHAWKLADLLKEVGIEVEIVKTTRPGYILYEDDHQVAAMPFRDTF
jgi:hypothetical protein